VLQHCKNVYSIAKMFTALQKCLQHCKNVYSIANNDEAWQIMMKHCKNASLPDVARRQSCLTSSEPGRSSDRAGHPEDFACLESMSRFYQNCCLFVSKIKTCKTKITT
jgi:hypothetical protein